MKNLSKYWVNAEEAAWAIYRFQSDVIYDNSFVLGNFLTAIKSDIDAQVRTMARSITQ